MGRPKKTGPNYFQNLEWVSIKKNNQHSKNISINMLDDNKNVIKTFSDKTDLWDTKKLYIFDKSVPYHQSNHT